MTQIPNDKILFEMLSAHPGLLPRILSRASGVLGEVWVAQYLESRGYEVVIHDNNLVQHDLTVKKSGVVVAEVEVKTGREKRPVWLVKTIPECPPDRNRIWVFVAAPKNLGLLPRYDDPGIEMFVLYAHEARDTWQRSIWNQKNPQAGDIRRGQLDDASLNA